MSYDVYGNYENHNIIENMTSTPINVPQLLSFNFQKYTTYYFKIDNDKLQPVNDNPDEILCLDNDKTKFLNFKKYKKTNLRFDKEVYTIIDYKGLNTTIDTKYDNTNPHKLDTTILKVKHNNANTFNYYYYYNLCNNFDDFSEIQSMSFINMSDKYFYKYIYSHYSLKVDNVSGIKCPPGTNYRGDNKLSRLYTKNWECGAKCPNQICDDNCRCACVPNTTLTPTPTKTNKQVAPVAPVAPAVRAVIPVVPVAPAVAPIAPVVVPVVPVPTCPNGWQSAPGLDSMCKENCRDGYFDEGGICYKNETKNKPLTYIKPSNVPSTCPSGTEYISGNCLSINKEAGYSRGFGYGDITNCPPCEMEWDFRTLRHKCKPKSCTIDSGEDRCNKENPNGCELDNELWYPKCKQGFKKNGKNCEPTTESYIRDAQYLDLTEVECKTEKKSFGMPLTKCGTNINKGKDRCLNNNPKGCDELYNAWCPKCLTGFTANGLSCNPLKPNCGPGDEQMGLSCFKNCDPGYIKDGLTCRKESYVPQSKSK